MSEPGNYNPSTPVITIDSPTARECAKLFNNLELPSTLNVPIDYPAEYWKPQVSISLAQEITIHGLRAISAQAADGTGIERLLNYYKEAFLLGYYGLNQVRPGPSTDKGPEVSLCFAYFFRPNADGDQAITFNISYAIGNAPAVYQRIRPRDLEPDAKPARLKALRESLSRDSSFYIPGADTFMVRSVLETEDRKATIRYCMECIRDGIQNYLNFIYNEARRFNVIPDYWSSQYIKLPSGAQLKKNSPLWKTATQARRTKLPEPCYRIVVLAGQANMKSFKIATPPQQQIQPE